MKRRTGFVSNSSSSSFIVIGDGEIITPETRDKTLKVPEDLGGETEFGWGPATHTDIGSRINFSYLQTEYDGKNQEMLENVIKEHLNVDTIEWSVDGYIDHQSSAHEGENLEMFESEDILKKFLFASDSLIEEDNDNQY